MMRPTPTARSASSLHSVSIGVALLTLVAGLTLACGGDSRSPTDPGPGPGPGPMPQNCPADYPDWQTSLYVLPYPVGDAYVVLQGNCKPISHFGDISFGYDFTMPIGSTITATRTGMVEEVVEHHPNFNGGGEGANIVVLRHPDGTRSRYGHLDQDGALVEVGEIVHQGDVIARSGASNLEPGDTAHLHYHVQEDVGRQTLPTTFRNTEPNPDGLIQGVLYVAEPYEPEDR